MATIVEKTKKIISCFTKKKIMTFSTQENAHHYNAKAIILLGNSVFFSCNAKTDLPKRGWAKHFYKNISPTFL